MHIRQLFDMSGQVALVTGAASGIGLAIAEAMAEAGAHVVLADIRLEGAQAASAALNSRGHRTEAVYIDVANPEQLQEAIGAAAARHERLDAVFANAGISAGPGPLMGKGHIGDLTIADWERVLRINLTGVLATMQAASLPMIKQRSGRIIATASTAAFRGDGMVGYAYVAAKSAVVNIVRQAAIELAPHNVLVNAIAPGPFRTGIGGGRMHLTETDQLFAKRLPLQRIGRPEEIKGAALLLAAPASSFMTGTVIGVDGGALAW